ncbi:MAG: T9SS type A sorting domain-containing protein [Ignavibacteria bacterium]|nr:T9SS type A sorting domain-containing protein [Ignavibacteria bacterium]
MRILVLALFFSGSLIVHAQVLKIDTTFGVVSQSPRSSVDFIRLYTMLPLEDGSRFALGDFTLRASNQTTGIAKLDQNGQWVPWLPVYSKSTGHYPFGLARQKSGRIVVGISKQEYGQTPRFYTGILGFDENGVVDTDFSADSITGALLQVLCIDSLDRILLGGVIRSEPTRTQYACIRLTSEGKIDPSFQRLSMSDGSVNSIAIDSLGRIYIGGSFDTIGGIRRVGVARLNPNGDVDETFDVRLDSGSWVTAVATQGGNGVLVQRRYSHYGDTIPRLRRYSFQGFVDTTFVTKFDYGDLISIAPNGKLYTTRQVQTRTLFVGRVELKRHLSNGEVDTTFTMDELGEGSIYGISHDGSPTALAYGYLGIVDRVNHQGMFGFDSSGRIDHSVNVHKGLDGSVSTVEVTPRGSLIIGGTQASLDTVVLGPSFTTDASGNLAEGYRQRTYPSEQLGYHSVAKTYLQADGRLLALDVEEKSMNPGPPRLSTLYRLLEDGTQDTTFIIDTNLLHSISAVHFDENGDVIIAGSFKYVHNLLRPGIARLNSEGAVYTSFNPGTGVKGFVYALAVQTDGKIIVGGSMNEYNGQSVKQVIRLFPDGTLDTSFKTPWTLTQGLNAGSWGTVTHIAIDSRNNVVIAGDYTHVDNAARGGILRLNSDGQLDSTFRSTERIYLTLNDLIIDLDDRPLMAGRLYDHRTSIDSTHVARFNSDGSWDNTFRCVVDGQVRGIRVVSRDTLFVFGEFDTVNSVARQNVARLLVNNNSTSIAEDAVSATQGPLVRLHPNPATEQITVELATSSGPCTLLLLDCTGQVIQRSNNVTSDSHIFDVQGVPPGFYIVMIQRGDHVSCSSFIKSE